MEHFIFISYNSLSCLPLFLYDVSFNLLLFDFRLSYNLLSYNYILELAFSAFYSLPLSFYSYFSFYYIRLLATTDVFGVETKDLFVFELFFNFVVDADVL